jgi:16S rRNA processing protein RimM
MADDFRFDHDRFLLVGKVSKPHGLGGEVKIYPYSADAATLLQYERAVLVDGTGCLSPALTIEKARIQGKLAVLKFSAIKDRDGAEVLHGRGMLIFKEDVPAAGEDEYYWFQFYDRPVYTENGGKIGTVASIFSNGAQDIMVVRDGDKEFLVPILDSIIKEQNENGIIIAPPPGLLEVNDGTNE